MRDVGHRDAETKGHAEVSLGNGEKALGEGITRRQEQRHHRQTDDVPAAKGQDQAEREYRQDREQDQRFLARHLAGGQRARLGARHVRIKIAVGQIVDHAAGRAHEHGA